MFGHGHEVRCSGEPASVTWEFSSGRGLDAQGLTLWQRTYAAQVLVESLAGLADLREGFATSAARVRAGESALAVAAAVYVPRNTEPQRRATIAPLLDIAAAHESVDAARPALLSACTPVTARALDDQDRAVPEEGDRRYAARASWRVTLARGGRLLALRGCERCLLCQEPMPADELRRPSWSGSDPRAIRRDYCADCERLPRFLDDHQRTRHVEAIRALLDAAAPVLTGSAERVLAALTPEELPEVPADAPRPMPASYWTRERRASALAARATGAHAGAQRP